MLESATCRPEGGNTITAKARNRAKSRATSAAQEITAPVESIPDRQVEEYARGANFAWVASVLTQHRDQIVGGWLDAASAQHFHKGRRERAVADHIPLLLDVLTVMLNTTAPSWIAARAPIEDLGILAAAQSHARARATQGLTPADVVVEFRLLRQEIWRALRTSLPDEAPTGDVVAAEMLINDALDSAITQGLAALTDYVQQLREEFLATTVHDVRQPLTVILGETQMLAKLLSRTAPDPERLHSGVKRIDASARRMMAMLEMLADMSRIALGSLDLQLGEANLEEIVSDVLIHCATEDAGRTLVRVRPEANLTGTWDRTRLMQVVENLLSNAFKYSASGTPVEIDLDADEDTALLVVRDYGKGSPARRSRLYSRATSAPATPSMTG